MLLALDIGNSNIVMGASQNGEWIHQWRIQTNTDCTADEYIVLFSNLFQEAELKCHQVNRIIIGSVVPQLTQTIKEVCNKKFDIEPLVLNGTVQTGITIKTSNPVAVGADLLADAVGAYDIFGDDCIVVDFGTATTVMVVQNPGELIGGAICAGLKVTIDALVGKTAQLSQIPMEPPPSVIGGNTMEAMQSGLVMGHLCMVESLIDKMRNQLGAAKAIATGGLSEKIGPHTNYFDVIDPMLTLNGLRLIVERQE